MHYQLNSQGEAMTIDSTHEVSRDGRGLRILLPGAATDGALAIVDCEIAASTSGPPLHIHPASEETFVVVSGQLLVHVDGHLHVLGVDEALHVPRGAAHTFATAPEDGARFLALHSPAGFEEFHSAAAESERQRGEPLGVDDLIALARHHDWALAGPPLLPSGDLARRP
jgi:mannose-6-phosphate isomerase-like protein (cupin superfamily)